ncbi:MAG: metallophosphoesterase [Candidatus Solibacter sp.]
MIIKLRPLLLAAALCGSLAAQTFIQMSDPQFGMYTKDKDFVQETANFEFAIAAANRLKPAFVVITGDLINKDGDAAMTAEYKRISSRLDPKIKLYAMPGNHDVGNEPTAETLAFYRENYGPDYYSFHHGDIAGIVLNSNLEKGTDKVPEEAAKMEAWFRQELERLKLTGVKHIIVFQHIPFFLKDADEKDSYDNIPKPVRERYLHLLHEYGVQQVFAGHYHANELGRDGELEMVTSGPVGMPLRGAKSGLRVVTAKEGAVTHKYHDFGELP